MREHVFNFGSLFSADYFETWQGRLDSYIAWYNSVPLSTVSTSR